MSVAVRALRVPAVVVLLWAAMSALVPVAMSSYDAYVIGRGPGVSCPQIPSFVAGVPRSLRTCGQPLTELYETSLPAIIADAALRSIVLLAGAAILALTLGVFIGAGAALARRRALASGAIVAATGLVAAIPSFFVAYFLQIAVIVFFSSASGSRLLPVYGFGYDEHVVLPLLAVAIPAVAITAQLTAARVSDVMDAEFVTTANAKGLLPSWILRVHVLPHALPVALEGLGSGLRVCVASLPIVEYIFQWNGIGYIALQSIASRDAAALTASAIVLVTLFATLSFIADLGRPRVAYR